MRVYRAADCDDMSRKAANMISARGGTDTQLLGLEHNERVGFNEPGTAFDKDTHLAAFTESAMKINRRFFEVRDAPSRAYTDNAVEEYTRHSGRRAQGENRKAAFFGPVTPLFPASVLQLYNNSNMIGAEGAMALIWAVILRRRALIAIRRQLTLSGGPFGISGFSRFLSIDNLTEMAHTDLYSPSFEAEGALWLFHRRV
jgi:hypothetical protein